MKKKTVTTSDPVEPKYRIAELLRQRFGELGVSEGKELLAEHCNLRNKRTISDWLGIRAGSSECISHHVVVHVLSFFDLKKEEQLYTTAHKALLNQQLATA